MVAMLEVFITVDIMIIMSLSLQLLIQQQNNELVLINADLRQRDEELRLNDSEYQDVIQQLSVRFTTQLILIYQVL